MIIYTWTELSEGHVGCISSGDFSGVTETEVIYTIESHYFNNIIKAVIEKIYIIICIYL